MAEIETARSRKGHFSEGDWVDFARQQVGGERLERLERHLGTECGPCRQALRVWQTLFGLATQEASYQPPDGVVRQARAVFAFRRPQGLLGRLGRRASLVFDSFRQPLPAGVRSAGASPRQLLYKAGRYLIMLRVEPAAGSDRMSVVGQILDEENPQRALEDLAVLALSGDETVERTLTNRLGEFQLEPGLSESLRISVGVPEIGSVSVPVPSLGPTGGQAGHERARRSGRKVRLRQP